LQGRESKAEWDPFSRLYYRMKEKEKEKEKDKDKEKTRSLDM